MVNIILVWIVTFKDPSLEEAKEKVGLLIYPFV